MPEVLQTSLMDCGPAALKAVLEGFGVAVSYDVLRERCQTDVDGTSIDALAALGRELGLESHELLVARDAFLLPEARCLPAIVVTRTGAGLLHFIVVWRVLGPFVQVMDPSSGRRWLHRSHFLELMPDVDLPMSAARWRRWAGSREGLLPLQARMRALGVSRATMAALCGFADADLTFVRYARLDAAVRMVSTLVCSHAVACGREAEAMLEELCGPGKEGGGSPAALEIPPRFCWARPHPREPEKLLLHGCVVVHFAAGARGRVPAFAAAAKQEPLPDPQGSAPPASEPSVQQGPLPPHFSAQLRAAEQRPLAALVRIMRFDLRGRWLLLVLALCAGALLVPAEGLLFRSLLSIRPKLALPYQLGAGIAVLLGFVLLGLWLELFVSSLMRRAGLGLESRLRVGLCEKLPRLDDSYLRTRPSSDMAARAHSLHHLREVPVLLVQAARALLTMVALGAGLSWLHPRGALHVLAAGALALALPFALRRQVSETGMRLRTHAAQLDGFFLDALLGVSAIRVHGAERAVRTAHEELLTEWGRTARTLHGQNLAVQGLSLAVSTGLAAALVMDYVRVRADLAGLLLFAFWAFRLPLAAQELALSELGLRNLRSVALRALAPLGAMEPATPEEHDLEPVRQGSDNPAAGRGISLALENVVINVSGHTLLHETSLALAPGSHVAIVGASGAGKSCLLGLLLGWTLPSSGCLRVDGRVLTREAVARLREHTAWVDPGVQLWDASLFDNLLFGGPGQAELPPCAHTRGSCCSTSHFAGSLASSAFRSWPVYASTFAMPPYCS